MSTHPKVWLNLFCLGGLLLVSCNKEGPTTTEIPEIEIPIATEPPFQGALDLSPNLTYVGQSVPDYILLENPAESAIDDAKATLGRVLFYDQHLSANQTISCASCHRQDLAFGDNTIVSTGVNGQTPRHAMRLFNVRFTAEPRFFWDERVASLNEQVLDPIRDHIEMGFSGEDGAPTFGDLLDRLNDLNYYKELSLSAYGSEEITEEGIREGLTHFIRSIQSFDSRYDAGHTQVSNGGIDFPNFTEEENRGKILFGAGLQYGSEGERVGGGFGCGNCHHTPEFSIDPDAGGNGVNSGGAGIIATRAPSLRNIFLPDGSENGPFMHNGTFANLSAVLDHYNEISGEIEGMDERLLPTGRPQRLLMTPDEKAAVIAFLKTLTGRAIFTDERWSDPFER